LAKVEEGALYGWKKDMDYLKKRFRG